LKKTYAKSKIRITDIPITVAELYFEYMSFDRLNQIIDPTKSISKNVDRLRFGVAIYIIDTEVCFHTLSQIEH